jgi:hypothetical protein
MMDTDGYSSMIDEPGPDRDPEAAGKINTHRLRYSTEGAQRLVFTPGRSPRMRHSPPRPMTGSYLHIKDAQEQR